jgi:hypothetical protein
MRTLVRPQRQQLPGIQKLPQRRAFCVHKGEGLQTHRRERLQRQLAPLPELSAASFRPEADDEIFCAAILGHHPMQ